MPMTCKYLSIKRGPGCSVAKPSRMMMASNFRLEEYSSEYSSSSSSSESDQDEEDLVTQWRRTYPGATNSYIVPPMRLEPARPMSLLPPVAYASDSGLSSRFGRLEIVQKDRAVDTVRKDGQVEVFGRADMSGKDFARDLFCKAYKKFTIHW